MVVIFKDVTPALVQRAGYLSAIREALKRNPVVSVLGPRQSGKTTLARQTAAGRRSHFFDLEETRSLVRLEHPATTLEPLQGLVVIDEVQRKPDLFPLLRVLADRKPPSARFLILGSASPALMKGVSETLAGRVAFVEVSGFSLREVGTDVFRRRWLRGGFPRSFLAHAEGSSRDWREDFIKTFLERDIPQLGISVPSATLRRFWNMVAHYHGQLWNAAEFARSIGAAEATARKYLDILSSSFMVRQLPPWFENLGKRQVKAPKVYVRDTGLLHSLLAIDSREGLEGHPKLGGSWEGFALEETLRSTGDRNAYFWATHAGAELDLLVFRDGKRYGFEFKYADAPGVTKSMHVALKDLGLTQIFVVYPGKESYRLHPKVEVVSILDLARKLRR